jgi:preprotein translocase subunit SecG
MKRGETLKGLTFIIVLAALFFVVYLVLGYVNNSTIPNVTPATTPKEGFRQPPSTSKSKSKTITSNKNQDKHRY